MTENKVHNLLGSLVDDEGSPKYTQTEVADVMAVIFMQSYRAVPMSSQAADDLMAGLLLRADVKTEEDLEHLDLRLATYFERVPLNQELLKTMQSALQSEQAPTRSVRAGYAIGSAF